jgi:hypothetical protein
VILEKFDMAKVPLQRVGIPGISQLAAYIWFLFVNGEVVVIDGGEWLKGAGQFNMLEEAIPELWDQLEMMIKQRRINK